MIDAKELRIGNWVNIDTELPYLVVHQIKAQDILDISLGTMGIKNRINPIPITPDILLKSGFELFPWGWVKKSSGEHYGLRITMKFYFEREGQYHLKIESLHQLQNLYYSLTGEELEINL